MNATPEKETAAGQADARQAPAAAIDTRSLRGRWTAFLSGMGYYRLSQRRRKLLTYVFAGSVAAHIVGLLIFGGMIVIRDRKEEVTIFQTPPPAKRYEPRKLEHRVKLQKRQRSSSRPAMMPRLVSLKPTQVALPEIKVDPKIIHTTFQPKFKAVSGKGLGAGLGTGYDTHGFGTGISDLNFFGIKARGEKVAILVDVSVSMVEENEEVGVTDEGIKNFNSVKHRINQVIRSLDDASMFSVITFADAAEAWQTNMVVAVEGNKTKAMSFLRPFNTAGTLGLTSGNVRESPHGLQTAVGGETRLDLALSAAFEHNADTILIISDGLPRVLREWTKEEQANHRMTVEQWQKQNSAAVAAWNNASANAETRQEKVWVPPRVTKEGQAGSEGRWETRTVRTSGGRALGPRPRPPSFPKQYWTFNDFMTHLDLLYKNIYEKAGQPPPTIHCIGFKIDKGGHDFLQKLARQYRGHYRRVRSL